jgi:hypothetical protein
VNSTKFERTASPFSISLFPDIPASLSMLRLHRSDDSAIECVNWCRHPPD